MGDIMKRIIIGFLVCSTIIAYHCEKSKTGEDFDQIDDSIFIIPETAAPHVEVPEVRWDHVMAVVVKVGQTDFDIPYIRQTVTNYIITGLSKIQNLKLIQLSKSEDINRIPINVDYLLTGEFVQEDKGLNIFYQIEDNQNNNNLWKEVQQERLFSDTPKDVPMAENVAQSCGFAYQIEKVDQIQPTAENVQRLFHNGKILLLENQYKDTDQAIQIFKQVLTHDSTYALAWMGLTEGYIQIFQNQWNRNLVWLQLAKESCLKALQLDPTLGDAYLALGEIYFGWGDYFHAETEFRNALQQNSNLDRAWNGLGKIYVHFGLYEPALHAYTKALSLNPINIEVSIGRAMILAGFGQYRTGEEEIRRSMALHPDKPYLHAFLALMLFYQNELKGAYDEVYNGMESDQYGVFAHGVLAMIYAKKGQLDDALGEVEIEVKPNVGRESSRAIMIAAVYALLGRNGLAIQWLDKAVSMGYREYPWLLYDPNLDGLRKDERFINLLKQVKNLWEEKMQEYSQQASKGEVG